MYNSHGGSGLGGLRLFLYLGYLWGSRLLRARYWYSEASFIIGLEWMDVFRGREVDPDQVRII